VLFRSTLAAKYHAPITIFVSATLALWTVTAIGVLIGCKAKQVIQPRRLQQVAAIAFFAAGIVLLVHG